MSISSFAGTHPYKDCIALREALAEALERLDTRIDAQRQPNESAVSGTWSPAARKRLVRAKIPGLSEGIAWFAGSLGPQECAVFLKALEEPLAILRLKANEG